jgi:tRNA wybutosine-synthesizing protein 4
MLPRRTDLTMDPADRPVIATAEDAILAKFATVQAGYYQDPFLSALSQRSMGMTHRPRRQVQPIIKRGTHARVCVMDRAIRSFLQHCRSSSATSAQVVVLGAGKDTSYFRYKSGYIVKHDDDGINNSLQVNWYEVDHPSVVEEKYTILQANKDVFSMVSQLAPTDHGYAVSSDQQEEHEQIKSSFHLIRHDLRESPSTLFDKLQLDSSAPTIYLMECVLMYLPNTASQALYQALATSCENVWTVCYEPILQSDPFGSVMEQNLVKLGVASPISSLLQTRTLDDQLGKLSQYFAITVGCDMWQAYETILTTEQRAHANRCEFLDEIEEWRLIMRHYCFLVARGGRSQSQGEDDSMTKVGPDFSMGFVEGKCKVARRS